MNTIKTNRFEAFSWKDSLILARLIKHMMYLLILHAYGINNEKSVEDVSNRSAIITIGDCYQTVRHDHYSTF